MIKHFTATLYLVARMEGILKIFLHKHKKLARWIGIGGHVENHENPLEALIREVREEIGTDVTLLPQSKKPLLGTPDAIELPPPHLMFEFKIDAYQDEPEHSHIDFVYIGTVSNPQEIRMREEYCWFSESELRQVDNLRLATYRIAHKAFAIGKKYL